MGRYAFCQNFYHWTRVNVIQTCTLSSLLPTPCLSYVPEYAHLTRSFLCGLRCDMKKVVVFCLSSIGPVCTVPKLGPSCVCRLSYNRCRQAIIIELTAILVYNLPDPISLKLITIFLLNENTQITSRDIVSWLTTSVFYMQPTRKYSDTISNIPLKNFPWMKEQQSILIASWHGNTFHISGPL